MRGFGAQQKVGIEVDHGVSSAGAVDTDRNPGVRALAQVAVHAERDLDVGFLGEEDLPHRNRLQRLFR